MMAQPGFDGTRFWTLMATPNVPQLQGELALDSSQEVEGDQDAGVLWYPIATDNGHTCTECL